ncbi:Aste57867_24392 [Aphanomyces stellatus]|uniref:Aste57867_24392 protein n=1 Tax=Aphanomyces stellatus TaxID=120398 RepID=A0A485LS69_9STRA|nr:hypothetical protein As57867_024316 [Aphanomyces stellatus]VFU01032.1 Aste57867_24392 [Aphanomyces stellatus]
MPRKGPPKSTRREDRDKERQRAADERRREEKKAERSKDALREFQNKAEMPDAKCAQRDLRRGLAAQGMNLERYGESAVQLDARGVVMEKSDPVGRGVPRGYHADEDEAFEYDDDST